MKPNQNFLKYFPDAELPESKNRTSRSSCLRVGAYFVLRKIIEECSLKDILGKNAKVSVFGIASAGKSAGGSGSGEVKGETYDLLSALEKEGMEVNPTLKKFYEESSHVHGSGAGPGGGDAMGDWKIDEVPQSEYTQDITSSYENYGDAALVVIGRRGGEGGDLPTEMSRFGQSADRHYLELSEEEEKKQVSDIWFFIITQQEDRHVKL